MDDLGLSCILEMQLPLDRLMVFIDVEKFHLRPKDRSVGVFV